MGNSNTSSGKSSSQNVNSGQPQWGTQPGVGNNQLSGLAVQPMPQQGGGTPQISGLGVQPMPGQGGASHQNTSTTPGLDGLYGGGGASFQNNSAPGIDGLYSGGAQPRPDGLPVQPMPGSGGQQDYNAMNEQLRTLPMQTLVNALQNGGMGGNSQAIMQMLMGQGGSNQWMNQAANQFQNVGQIKPGEIKLPGQVTPGEIGTGNFQNILDQSGQGGAASQYLTDTAAGNYLGGSPYLDDIIARGSEDAASQVNNMFASGGRYGSVGNQGAVADSVLKYGNELRNANYQSERDRQMGAANALEAAQQGRMGIGLNAAQGMAGVQGQNIGNQMTAQQQNIANSLGVQGQNIGNQMAAQGQNIANQLGAAGQLGALGQSQFGNQMQGLLGAAGLENQGFQNMMGMISQLPTIQGNKIFDAQQQMGIGSQIDQRTQQGLQDRINQWTQGNNEDWTRIGGLISSMMGAAGPYGTQTGTQTQPVNAMGILGGLLGMFSDRRLKSDIKRVGTLDNGLPVYSYRFGDGPIHIGLMADEVEKVRPEAVSTHESGYKMVRYDLATEAA